MTNKTKDYTITVSTFYDVITPESASRGDYDQTGCDFQSYHFNNCIKDAVDYFMNKYNNNCWDCYCDPSTEVLYAVDPDIDYQDGSESYDRLCITVDSENPEVKNRVQTALSYLIMKRI